MQEIRKILGGKITFHNFWHQLPETFCVATTPNKVKQNELQIQIQTSALPLASTLTAAPPSSPFYLS